MWFSPSVRLIMGYSSEELVGRSPFDIAHPEELEALKQLRDQALSQDMVAGLIYTRLRHAHGHYVFLAVTINVVYDAVCGSWSEAVIEPREKLRAATASEVYVVSPDHYGIFETQDWHTAPVAGYRIADPFLTPIERKNPKRERSVQLAEKRTFFILDRFSQNDNISYISNDVFIGNPSRYQGKPFYDIIGESDREKIRLEIDMGKRWAAASSSGIEHSPYSYTSFTLDAGDEPIRVQGVCASYSDGILFIIRRKRYH